MTHQRFCRDDDECDLSEVIGEFETPFSCVFFQLGVWLILLFLQTSFSTTGRCCGNRRFNPIVLDASSRQSFSQYSFLLGHSAGEFAGCVIAGILDFQGPRSPLCEEGSFDAASAAERCHVRGQSLCCTVSDVEDGLQANAPSLDHGACACHNGHQIFVLSGPENAVQYAVSLVGKSSRRLAASHAFHSSQMNEAAHLFEEFIHPFRFSQPKFFALEGFGLRLIDDPCRK